MQMSTGGEGLSLVELPLTRLSMANKKLSPFSPAFSRSAIAIQIELCERMLNDIQLIRLRLRRSHTRANGRGFRAVYCSGARGHPARTYSRAVKCRRR
jgi:hypothetical protein